MNGAATSPDAAVFAYAAAQVKKAMEVTQALGGELCVLGGREGYQSLLNTDLSLELDHMAKFLKMAVEFKKQIGFNATLLLEPKPQEPTKHQYDRDAATSLGFLAKYGLEGEFKLNIECNHATLSGHSCEHELEVSRIARSPGERRRKHRGRPNRVGHRRVSNQPRGRDKSNVVRHQERWTRSRGFNFDAKLRRESTDVEDLVIAHISGIDALARGLRAAAKLVSEGRLEALVRERYASFESGVGAQIEAGEFGFNELELFALGKEEPATRSAKQELVESIFYSYI